MKRLAWLLPLLLFAPLARAQDDQGDDSADGDQAADPGEPPASGAAPGGPAGPMMGGAGGMPNPRMMSGVPRPQEGDPLGQITVRAIQGTFHVDELGNRVADFPKTAVVHLVSLGADGQVSAQDQPVDGEGRAVFKGLATDGSAAYYAMAVYPRPGGEDRLASQAIVLPPQVGIRLMLAGEAKDSSAPPADDLVKLFDEFEDQTVPPPGNVVVRVRGQTEGVKTLGLIQVGGKGPERGTALVTKVGYASIQVQGDRPVEDAALRDGLLQVKLARGQGGDGIAGVSLDVVDSASQAVIATQVTGADGVVNFEGLAAGRAVVVKADIHGKKATSGVIVLPKKGGSHLAISADWEEAPNLEGSFGDVAGGDAVYVAAVEQGGRHYYSAPFQLTKERGVAVGIFVYPDLIYSFHGGAQVDDERLWFEMQISLINPTVMPRPVTGPGLEIPLPKGFVGGTVDGVMAAKVSVVKGKGLVWQGAVPPGQKDFVVSYALDIDGGSVHVDLPLPFGAWQSQMVFDDLPGLKLDVPASAHQEKASESGRNFVVLGDINIEPGQSLVMGVHGLPQHPVWRRNLRWGVGISVMLLLGWGLVAVFGAAGRRGDEPRVALERERERLLDELVALEDRRRKDEVAEAAYRKSKGQLTRSLEQIMAELDGEAGAEARR